MKNHTKRASSVASLVACGALLLLTANQAAAALESPLAGGHVPAVTAKLRPISHADPSQNMRLAISLPMRDPAAWQALLQDLYDPTSPNYRHFLKPGEVTERFGPTAAAYQSVVDFAKANGLAVTGTYPNRMIVDVEGTVATVEKAFHTTINVYQHPSENRTFVAPTVEPTLDLATPILHITGLNNYSRPHPLWRQHKPEPKPVSTAGSADKKTEASRFGSGPFGTYQGNDFRPAYMPGVSLDGSGQSVALVEFDGYTASDVSAFEGQSGLPAVTLTNVLIDGFNGVPSGTGGEVEVTLDIDMAISMAPGLNKVLVYESQNGDPAGGVDQYNRIATDDAALQISSSWTLRDDPFTDQALQTYAAQGQSFFNAAGDDGAFIPFNIELDSDNPYCTVVGGTTLFTSGPGGSYVSEQVWNWNTEGFGTAAGGGGISPTIPLPTWQIGVADAANLASTQFRNSPDVALTADNIFIIADNGVSMPGTGGTSAASPLWAGFMALVNQQCASYGIPSIGFANPAIYALGKSPLYESLFHDITVGSNTNAAGGPIDYPAVVGYDLASGWGTPTPSLIAALAPKPQTPVLLPYSNSVTGGNGNGAIDPNECDEVLVTITNAGSIKATGVEGVLTSETYPAVSVSQSIVSFPDVPPFTAVTALAPFTVSASSNLACGTPIHLALTLKSDQVTATNTMTFTNGVLASPDTFSWTPTGAAPTIPIGFSGGLSESLTVNGLQTLGKATVSVNISSLYDAGLTIRLISPNGTSVTLASGDGGNGSDFGLGCDSSTSCTFDDSSPTPIGAGLPPYVGSYAPQSALAALDFISGSDLNGTWTLNVEDEFPGDTATLNCWSLALTPIVCDPGPGQCPGSDLGISISPLEPVAVANSNFVWLVTATNNGPGDATDVVVDLNNTPGTGFVTASNLSQGTASFGPTGGSWNLGSLPVGSGATAYITVLPTIPEATFTTTVSIGAPGTDPNLNNNTAAGTELVARPGADLGVTIAANPNPVLENGRLTYTVVVTNNGPFSAEGVVLTTLVPNANFVSAATTQGTVTGGGSLAQLGTIPAGSGATVTLVVSPTAAGSLTATASVTLSSTEVDPVSANNAASVTTTVNSSADLGVSAAASPLSTIAGSNLTYVAVISNAGPSDATDVTFTHFFPIGATFLSTSISGLTVETNLNPATLVHSLVWHIGFLGNHASETVTTILASPTNVSAGAPPVLSSFTVVGQPGDPNTNNNVVNITTVNSNAFVSIVPAGMTLISGSTLHPGDTGVAVDFVLHNQGNIPVSGLTATLESANGIQTPSPSGPTPAGVGGTLASGGSATNRFTFNVAPNVGSTVTAVLSLQASGVSLGTASYVFTLPVESVFSNAAFISIPDEQFIPLPDKGPANPYPSTITVSNVTGLVGAVTVTVSNLTHSNPNDISMLLVSPTGLKTVLMASNALGSSVSNATITFTPNTNAPLLPEFGSIVSGEYQPTDYATPAYFPSPAPVGPYEADLAVYDGAAPPVNGVWSLYVYDAGEGDSGSIGNGWSLDVETITPVNQVADLEIAATSGETGATLGGTNVYFVAVTNLGPSSVTALVTNSLSSGLQYVSSSIAATASGGVEVFNLGVLSPGTGLTFTETALLTGNAAGPQTNTFGVLSSVPTVYDPVPANNVSSVVIGGELPVADVAALVMPASSAPVLGESHVYTLVVSNAGPQIAKSVSGTFQLNGLTNVSSLPAGAAIGGQAVYNFGDLQPGNVATLQITATPLHVGLVSNAWVVSTVSVDTNTANNTNWVVATVENPTPIIIGGPAILVTPGVNGTINAGQAATVSLVLSNGGYASTTNLVATLQASANIAPGSPASESYGALAPGATASEPFTFTASGAPGATVTAVWSLSEAGSGVSYGTVSNSFILPGSYAYSNAAAIVIPDVGPATPYPSVITVTGVPGVVTKVTATLHGFAHTFPRDVNVVLEAPNGQTVMLMSHAGGPYAISNGVTLTFDDSAAGPLPTTLLTSGTYLGTEYAPIAPLPGFTTPVYNTALAALDGSAANGNWTLYVDDDTVGNNGLISQGWSLNFDVINPVNPVAHLEVTVSNTPSLALAGAPLTYQITVTNRGPGDALLSTLTATLSPDNATIGPISLPISEVGSTSGGIVVANLGTIPAGSAVPFTIQVTPNVIGLLTNSILTTTASVDPFGPAPQPLIDVVTVSGGAKWAASLSGGTVQLTLTAGAGQGYIVETSTNLTSWTALSTNTAGTDGTITITDQTTNAPSRFFRAVYAPQ